MLGQMLVVNGELDFNAPRIGYVAQTVSCMSVLVLGAQKLLFLASVATACVERTSAAAQATRARQGDPAGVTRARQSFERMHSID
jgi:hypothetical protein